MKKFIKYSIGIFLFVLILSTGYKVTSTGAPIGSTGAPDENTCAKAGCHTGTNTVNTGLAQLSIDLGDAGGEYIPGKTYSISVSLTQKQIQRFGFSLTALDENNKSIGELKVSDSGRTQLMKGVGSYTGREYVTYTAAGTAPYVKGQGKWNFNWTAPTNYAGKISFYAAAVAANNDGTDLGDSVYTKSVIINKSQASSAEENAVTKNKLKIYPNPVKTDFFVDYSLEMPATVNIALVDESGKQYSLWQGYREMGNYSSHFVRPQELTGIYILRITAGERLLSQKLILE